MHLMLVAAGWLGGLVQQPDRDASLKRVVELSRLMEEAWKAEQQGLPPKGAPGDIGKWRKEKWTLLRALAGPAEAAQDELEERTIRSQAPDLFAKLKEPQAVGTLKTLGYTQLDFRANDRDNNRSQDFWVGDVHALHFLCPVDGQGRDLPPGERWPMKLLTSARVGLADAAPLRDVTLSAAPPEKPLPYWGYLYAALSARELEGGTWERYDDGSHRNRTRFGFCAVPADPGPPPSPTFILNEEGDVWKKDTGGKRPEGFPRDPAKAGWTKVK